MLTYFWLTHTNDDFFNCFGFNWVPSIELRKKVQEKINSLNLQNIKREVPFLKPIELPESKILNAIEFNITNSSLINYKT